ncbi:transposase [Streptomyces sp. NPDC020794]|uniref:transposase n=1 Tax=unclassified Streptomyces TaxID=2593676 RepID=UPI0036EBC5C8
MTTRVPVCCGSFGAAPMAGRLPVGDTQVVQEFVNQSPWDPLPVRRRIAWRLSGVFTLGVWVIDDVAFPGCGRALVGRAAGIEGRSRSGRSARSRSVPLPPLIPPPVPAGTLGRPRGEVRNVGASPVP